MARTTMKQGHQTHASRMWRAIGIAITIIIILTHMRHVEAEAEAVYDYYIGTRKVLASIVLEALWIIILRYSY